MEDSGHSQIILKCGHPYSSFENIDFKVEPGSCANRRNYNLYSEVHGPHIVSKHNPQKCFVLTHKKYNITLKQWLDKNENQNNWCKDYQSWGVNRPKEEARQIIHGILRAVYELHSDGFFHGFLYHSENFAIQYDKSVIGGDHKVKQVFLIHENCNLEQSFGVPTNNKFKSGKQNDMLAVKNVIFDQIIRGQPFSRYPQDLQNLHELLGQRNVDNWKHIVNHPSLWHWKSRFSYAEHVWMQFLNAKQSDQEYMTRRFSKIRVQGWTQRIPSGTALEKVLNYKNLGYGQTAKELLRYLRNVRVHYKDEWHGCLNEQFIEHMTTEVSELFLVRLYELMCELHIEI